jgi:2-hydroxychromene-2-carboxylate isomerase
MNDPRQKRSLEFWFDFASTYSYIAAMRIEDLCRNAGVSLSWTPFLLGPIFGMQGWNDSPFNLNPRRGGYMWRDLERLTTKFGLPWVRPTRFPRASTLAARVAAAAAGEPWLGDYIRAIFVANFGQDRDIGERAVVEDVLRKLSLPADIVVERALAPDQRGRLRSNTERAIEVGIFGAPDCLVDGELFWGEESLEDAIAWAAR